MITHVVMFKLLDRSPENIRRTRDVLTAMEGKIPQLKSLEVGIDVLRSERSYDIVLIAKFDSLEDLKLYNDHPVHQEVLRYIATVKDVSIAVDYES
jgi:hypothetical protein